MGSMALPRLPIRTASAVTFVYALGYPVGNLAVASMTPMAVLVLRFGLAAAIDRACRRPSMGSATTGRTVRLDGLSALNRNVRAGCCRIESARWGRARRMVDDPPPGVSTLLACGSREFSRCR